MRLRRFIKRAVKPFVMVGIVGTLSLSLIVTTPSNAQAFVPPPAVPAVMEATAMVLPRLMPVASILGPVGWGILGVTALGVGLYATKDYWLPYVTGDAGKPKDTATAPAPTQQPVGAPPPAGGWPAGSVNVWPGLIIADSGADAPVKTANHEIRFTTNYSGTGFDLRNGAIAGAAFYISCKTSTGAISNRTDATMYSFGDGTGTYGRKSWISTRCNTNETIMGAVMGAPSAAPELPKRCTDTAYWCGKPGSVNVVKWGTLAAPDTSYDPKSPQTQYRAEVECVDSAGNFSTITALTSGDSAGINMPSCAAAGKGHGTGKVKVFVKPNTTAPEEVMWDVPRADSDPAMPLCDAKKPGSGCKLGVKLDNLPCVAGTFECEHWSELSKDPNYTPRYSCQYGPYSVPLETCNPLERGYEPGGAPATNPNVDGDPATRSNTGPDGKTDPGTTTGTVPGVIPGAGAAGVPEGSTQEQKDCFPTGWAMLNPVEWVMKPVGCALDAAFRPKKDLQTRLTGMQGQFSNKVPLSWFGVGIEGGGGGGCPADWAVSFKGERYSLICGTEAENIIRGFRPVLGGMLVMAMLWPFIRSLFYAAIPVFKVTPS